MIGWLTTSRKATVATAVAILGPLYVLIQSDQPITWRAGLAAVVAGVLAWGGTYGVPNTEQYVPKHQAGEQ